MHGDDGGANWPGTFADDRPVDAPAHKTPRGRRMVPPVFLSLYVLAVGGMAAAIVVACLPNPDVARYKNASQDARDALAAAQEVAQSIRPEWTAEQYRGLVERQHAEAGGFLESDEAAELSEFAGCLELAFLSYRQVGDYLESRQLAGSETYGRAEIRQRWQEAGQLVEYAGLLLDPQTTEQALRDLHEFLRDKGERSTATDE